MAMVSVVFELSVTGEPPGTETVIVVTALEAVASVAVTVLTLFVSLSSMVAEVSTRVTFQRARRRR